MKYLILLVLFVSCSKVTSEDIKKARCLCESHGKKLSYVSVGKLADIDYGCYDGGNYSFERSDYFEGCSK